MASSPDNTPAAIPPRPGSGSDVEINPQLDNVLRNLNVNLEDELARYRRQRHGRVPPPPPPRRPAQRKTIDLISVSATAPSESPSAAPAQPPSAPPPPPPNPFLQQTPDSEPDTELPDLEQLPQEDVSFSTATDDIESSFASNDEVALPVPTNETPTEGYLESSEELLKSIEDDQAEPDSVPDPYSPERKNNGLLKLAGLVLVLLGGVGVGFAITYPSQLQNLRSQIWPTADSTTEPTDTATTTPETSAPIGNETSAPSEPPETPATAPVSPDDYKPPGPDLSTQEFKELDDVQDLVTLDVNEGAGTTAPTLSNPAQTPIPAPATTPTQEPATATPTPAPATGTTPPGADATTPTAATPPAAPAPTAAPTIATATGSNFYVIASYTGDDSLNKAREFVPDAFVRNFKAGARIQLAAFDNRAQAEDQVAALTQQGATVELFGPTNE